MIESATISQCRLRLKKLEEAVAKLQQSGDSEDAHIAWSDILSSMSTIYSKLEQGSKVNGKATAWFGRVKAERKSDPLLSYVHHARNSEEHNVEWVVGRLGCGIGISQMSGGTFIAARLPDGTYATEFYGGPEEFPPLTQYLPPSLQLLPVRDSRFNDVFDPPDTHLGDHIGDHNAATIAPLLSSYARNLIEAAMHFGI